MLFNEKSVVETLKKRVGFSQNENGEFATLSDDLVQPEAPYKYDLNGVITNFELISSLYDDNTHSSLESFIAEIVKASILNLVNKFIRVFEKENTGFQKHILKDSWITRRRGNFTDVLQKQNKFRGLKLVLKRTNSISVTITNIALHFKEAQIIRLYLYRSTSLAPIKQYELDYNKPNEIQNFKIPLVLKYFEDDEDETDGRFEGEEFFIGYYEDELNTSNYAITSDVDYLGRLFRLKHHDSYFRNSYFHQTVQKIVSVKGIESLKTNPEKNIPEFNNYMFDFEYDNFGLHLKLNAKCDFTNVIKENAGLFDYLLIKSFDIFMAEKALFSDKYNSSTALMRKDYITKMLPKIKKDFEEMLKSVVNEFRGLDSTCFQHKQLFSSQKTTL